MAQNKNMTDFKKLVDFIVESNSHLGVEYALWGMDRKVKGQKQEFRCDFLSSNGYSLMFRIKILLDHK